MAKKPSLPDYPGFLAELKHRISRARISAARAVNHELVLLYWDIGRGIVEKQRTAGWGGAVVERLAADLLAEFPGLRGFSSFNLWRMRQFYIEYSSPGFLAQAVPEMETLPGGPPAQVFPEIAFSSGAGHPVAPSSEIVSQSVKSLVAAVPWGHHPKLLRSNRD